MNAHSSRRRAVVAASAAALITLLTGCDLAEVAEAPPASSPTVETPATTHEQPQAPDAQPAADPAPAPDAAAGTALATVDLLEVKGRAPKTGYDRDAFAYREFDIDRNGCDARIICSSSVPRRDIPGLDLH